MAPVAIFFLVLFLAPAAAGDGPPATASQPTNNSAPLTSAPVDRAIVDRAPPLVSSLLSKSAGNWVSFPPQPTVPAHKASSYAPPMLPIGAEPTSTAKSVDDASPDLSLASVGDFHPPPRPVPVGANAMLANLDSVRNFHPPPHPVPVGAKAMLARPSQPLLLLSSRTRYWMRRYFRISLPSPPPSSLPASTKIPSSLQ